MLTISAHQGDSCIRDVNPQQLREWLERDDGLFWVDILDPKEEDFRLLQREFDFHPLALEDVRDRHPRAKIDFYEGYAFIVFYAVHSDTNGTEITVEEVELFVGHNYIVTLHDLPVEELEEIRARWETNASRIGQSITTLLYSILDTILDDYFPVLDRIADRLDELEQGVFEEGGQDALQGLLQVKRDLLALRRVVGPQRDVVNVLLRGESTILPEAALPYLQDLYDHALRVVEVVDTYREMVGSVTDAYLSVQSNNMSQVMQRLTVINLLFLPLVVLTAFFGMNFEALPFGSTLAMIAAFAAMIALPVGMWLWMRHQGWF